MILKVKCVDCGKKGKVLIIKKKILSRWAYFGKILKIYDYWECPKCHKKGD